jgi:hypothetical protein
LIWERSPSLEYACQFWYTHARAALEVSQQKLNDLISDFFSLDEVVLSWARIHRPDNPTEGPFQTTKATRK